MAYKKEYPVLNDSGAGSLEEYTKRQEDRIEEAFTKLGDYVVERGSSSKGYWEKWNNGKMAVWGDIRVELANDKEFGSVYWSGVQELPLPQRFASTPEVKLVNATNFTLAVAHSTPGGDTLRYTTLSFDSPNRQSITVEFFLIGKWK